MLKWYGGKTKIAKWVGEHFPKRAQYTHFNVGCAGGLNEFTQHDPTCWLCELATCKCGDLSDGKAECVNDLNPWLSNFWWVMGQEELFEAFSRRMQTIPFGSIGWNECVAAIDAFPDMYEFDSVTAAVVFFVQYRQSRQGLGTDYATPTKRLRRGMMENVSAWLSAVDGLADVHRRMIRVEVVRMDVCRFIKERDHPLAFFYLDPPYLGSTRTVDNAYAYEMSETDHFDLLDTLEGIKGLFLLSGYHSVMYENWAKRNGFKSDSKIVANSSSSSQKKEERTEMLWWNY